MNDVFEKKVRSAAVALWWVVLISWAVVIFQWCAYLTVMHTRPGWMLTLWGPNMDWPFVQMVWFWAVGVLKLLLWLMLLIALWLTIWARQLRKHSAG